MAALTESLSSRAVGEVPTSTTMSISQEPSDGRFSSTSADESPGLTTFSLFSLLPAELRLKIWSGFLVLVSQLTCRQLMVEA